MLHFVAGFIIGGILGVVIMAVFIHGDGGMDDESE